MDYDTKAKTFACTNCHSGNLFFAGSLFYLPEYMEAGIFLICYIVVGWDIVWKAITNILHGQVFDENFLMTIATIGALVLGEHSEA